jgi:regulatory protein
MPIDGDIDGFVPLEDPEWANLPEGVEREAVARAKSAALRLLKARDRTPVALAERLRKKEIDEAVIAHVIARLEAVGLLDERATAGRFVRAELRKSAAAERLLKMKLRKAGVSDEIAGAVIAEELEAVDLEAAVEAEARRWLERRPGLESEVAKRRLAGRLARRGFGGDLVWRVVNRVVGERG